MERSAQRIKLQRILEEFAKEYVKPGDKTKHVYYNPPTGFQMEYPCYVYEDNRPSVKYADNQNYLNFPCWKVTTMTRDPESMDLAPKLEELCYCVLENPGFRTDGISHRIYTLYF